MIFGRERPGCNQSGYRQKPASARLTSVSEWRVIRPEQVTSPVWRLYAHVGGRVRGFRGPRGRSLQQARFSRLIALNPSYVFDYT